MPRRSRLEITKDMLASIADAGGTLAITRLMYKSNLSHPQMKGYLEELEEKEFLAVERKKRSAKVHITDTGRMFLQKLVEIAEFEESFGL